MSVLNQIYNEVILAKSIDGLIIILDGPDKLKKDLKNKDVIIYDSNKIIQNGIYSTSLLLYRFIDKNDFSEGTFYFLIESSIQIIDGWKFFTTNKNILDNTGEILDMDTEQNTCIEIKPINDKIMQNSTTSDTFTIQNKSIQVISNDNDFKLIKELKEWVKNEINNNILEIKNELKESIKNECLNTSKEIAIPKKGYKYFSKLTKEQVIEIKKLIKEGKKNKEIMEMFPVGKTAISNIKCGVTWNNVVI